MPLDELPALHDEAIRLALQEEKQAVLHLVLGISTLGKGTAVEQWMASIDSMIEEVGSGAGMASANGGSSGKKVVGTDKQTARIMAELSKLQRVF